MFNPDQFIVSEPQYNKITDGGKWLPNAMTGEPLVNSLPPIDRDDLRIENPDFYLRSALFSNDFFNALTFLEEGAGTVEFSAHRFNQKGRPLIEKFAVPDLIDTELYMGTVTINTVKYNQILTNQGNQIEFRPIKSIQQIPSLRIEPMWFKGENEGDLIFQPKLAVFKKNDLSEGLSVGVQMEYFPEEYKGGIRQISTVHSISIPSGLVEFQDPINNMRSITLDLTHYTNGIRPLLRLSLMDYFSRQFALTDYLVVKKQKTQLKVVNRGETKGSPRPNTKDRYGNYIDWIANNLVFLLGEKLTGKRFVDLTP